MPVIPVVAVVPVVIAVDVGLEDLARAGVHLVLVLDASRRELHLVHAVIQLVLVVVEARLGQPELGEHDVLRRVEANVAAVIELLGRHRQRVGGKAKAAHRCAHIVLDSPQELLARIARALLKLHDHIAVVPVDGLVEVPCLVNLLHQVGDDLPALASLVAPVPARHPATLVVHALDLGDEAIVVILDLNLGVDAQKQGSRRLGCLSDRGLAGTVRRLRRCGRRPAARQNRREGDAHGCAGQDVLQARGLHGVLLGS